LPVTTKTRSSELVFFLPEAIWALYSE
jgi:hypothetical protein